MSGTNADRARKARNSARGLALAEVFIYHTDAAGMSNEHGPGHVKDTQTSALEGCLTHLEAHGNVKVFRDMHVRPILGHPIRSIHERTVLDCAPAQECIVADKGRDVASGDGHHDGIVDGVCEKSHCVLKVVMGHLLTQGRGLSKSVIC